MVHVRYCEICGVLVTQEQLDTRIGIDVDGHTFCERHMNLAPAPAKHDSGIRRTSTRPKSSSRIRHASDIMTQRARTRNIDHGVVRNRSRRSVKSPAPAELEPTSQRGIVFLFLGATTLIVIIGIFIVMSYSDSSNSNISHSVNPQTEPLNSRPTPTPNGSAGKAQRNTPPSGAEPASPAPVIPATPKRHRAKGDADGDGMPDFRESIYDLNPDDLSDAWADPDGDGFINLQEIRGQTRPKDKTSYPKSRMRDSGDTPGRETIILNAQNNIILDTYIDSDQPDRDVSSKPYLRIESHPQHHIKRTFIKFNLTGISPDDIISVKSVRIRLTADTHFNKAFNPPHDILTGACDTDFETIKPLTWNTGKDIGLVPGTENHTTLDASDPNKKIEELDATNAVTYFLETGHPNTGFIIQFADEKKKHAKRAWLATEQDGTRFRAVLQADVIKKHAKFRDKFPVITQPADGSGMTAQVGKPITFTCNISDPDDATDTLNVKWFTDAGLGLKQPDSTDRKFTFKGYGAPGVYVAVLIVTDPSGAARYAAFPVTVTE